ncbi:MAG: glycosyltransferase [Clostridia bacterium]|nr:glycosyltransferase [Clostridia bacterium]
MKKITFLMLHLNYGGLEKQTITLINELAKINKYKIKILSIYDMLNGQSFYEIDKRVEVEFLSDFGPNHKAFYHALKHKRILRFLKESYIMIKCGIYKSIKLKKYLKKLDTDIIVSSRIEFSKQIKRRDTLNISQEHSYIMTEKYIAKIRKYFKNIDKVVVMTDRAKREYDEILKSSNSKANVVNIPNMIDKNTKEYTAQYNNNQIISVGRLEKEKDFETLIDVFAILYKENKNITLKIAGEGSQRAALEEKIRGLNLQEKVKLLGRISSDEINEELAKSKLFILTSLGESFSLVLCEAMECGVPCISFNIDVGPKEIIQNGYNGILVDNRDKEKMAKEAKQLIEDEEKWNTISKNSKEYVKKYYSENVVNEWIEILK